MTENTRTVLTHSNRGQWENVVEGHPDLSHSYTSRDEAVEEGRAVAHRLGWAHRVEDAEPTGAITDPQQDDEQP